MTTLTEKKPQALLPFYLEHPVPQENHRGTITLKGADWHIESDPQVLNLLR